MITHKKNGGDVNEGRLKILKENGVCSLGSGVTGYFVLFP
jgi:hypothetical protein